MEFAGVITYCQALIGRPNDRQRPDEGTGQGPARRITRRDQGQYPHSLDLHTVEQCVCDWLDSLTLDPDTIASYRGQAQKWIYPRIGKAKLKTFTAKEAERFLSDLGQVLSKRSVVMIKSTLTRSIRRPQKHDLIGRNVAELADLPEGQPGRPSRAMTQQQAAEVLQAAAGQPTGYVAVVTIGKYRQAATHAAGAAGELACGNKPATAPP